MMDKKQALAHLHSALGHKPLNRLWAKAEILLGLLATGVGVFLGNWAVGQAPELLATYAPPALFLFVLGGYLALAGSRSHIYQSNNELVAYLAKEIHDSPRAPTRL
jgi:hypothetical protein